MQVHGHILGTLANWLHLVSMLGGCGSKHIPCSGCCNHRFYTCKLLASCMHAGAGGGGVGFVDWIQDSTQEEKMGGGKPFVDGRDEARS